MHKSLKLSSLLIAGTLGASFSAQSANLIQNGSFETNSATGTWTGASNELGDNPRDASSGAVDHWLMDNRAWLYEDYTGGANFSDGNFAAGIDGDGANNGIDVLAQTGLSLEAGTEYSLSFDLWGQGESWDAEPAALDVRLSYGWADALDPTGGTGVTLLDEKTTVGNDGFYETVVVNFTAKVTDANYALQFFVDNTTAERHSYIDNISLAAVPEPSSAALLGLGGIALIIRRRR